MAVKSLYIAAAAILAAIGVNAQSAPNWAYIPTACSTQCAQTIQSSYLCSQQHPNDSLNTYACFCADYPSDASSCATCLNSNNAAALASLLTSTQTACPQAQKSCFFACSFDTCGGTDVACACSATYLSNIYNCGSCNTANGNTQATQLKDFQALQDSCKNQNYTGATQSFTTKALPAATNKAAYTAPQLTATGGGVAATGSAGALGAISSGATGGSAPTTISNAASASGAIQSAASSISRAASSGAVAASGGSAASSASRSASSGASSVSGAAASATSSRSAGGMNVAAPAGGVLALIGAVVALL